MAITQQLARIGPDQLRACQNSAQKLDEVVSFKNHADDYLDLNWSPPGWEQAALAAGLVATAGLLGRACGGDAEVNPDYRDYPGTIFEHPVSFLTPGATVEVAEALARMDPWFLSTATLGLHRDLIPQLKEFVPTADPSAIYMTHLTALVSFYAVSSERHLATMVWWD